jgi:hypothetical protein
MNELHWPPAVLRKLTISQLICLLSERPPGRERISTPEEYQAVTASANQW